MRTFCSLPGFLLTGFLMMAVGCAALAQQTPPPPDPVNLNSDWWQYFENAGDQLESRIDTLVETLESALPSLSPSSREQSARTVEEIRQDLDLYARLRSQQQITIEPLPPARESYTLNETLELARQLRDSELESAIERDDIVDREATARQARRQLDNLRADYFKLEAQSADKAETGLAIIRDRTQLSLANEELRLVKPLTQRRSEQEKALRQQLEIAIANLIVAPGDVARYSLAIAEYGERAEQLENEAAHFRLRNSNLAINPGEQAVSRLNQQRLIELQVRLATAKLAQSEAALSAAFTYQLAPENASDVTEGIDQIAERFDRQLGRFAEERIKWRRATDSERRRAEAQLSLTSSSNGATNPENGVALEVTHRDRIATADRTLDALAALREQLARGELVRSIVSAGQTENLGAIGSAWRSLRHALTRIWAGTSNLVTGSLFTINETPVTLLGMLRILAILAVAWWLSKFLRHGLSRLSEDSDDVGNRASLYTLGRLLHYLILAVGILIGLSSIGLDFTKLTLFVSALGVGLGFGLQAIFSNFVAGLIILFEKSLKVGDFVELESGVTGEVREINIRSTLITTNDNIDILVPNSEFVSGRVTNWTLREAFRRIKVPFGVAYGTDKNMVKKAVLEAADAVPFTLRTVANRVPQVWLVEFGDSSLNFELVVWLLPEAVGRPAAVHAAYTWEIETALSKAGIEIPFPQRDLHIRSGLASFPDEGNAA